MSQPTFEAALPQGEYDLYREQIATLPEALRTVVEAITPAHMHDSYRAGGWSARQLIHHLADSHMNLFCRIKLALTEDKPTIKPFNQDAWADLPDDSLELVQDSLMLLEGLHRRMSHLATSLKHNQRSRTYYHPGYDRWYTVDQAFAAIAWHGLHHLSQLKQIIPDEIETPRG